MQLEVKPMLLAIAVAVSTVAASQSGQALSPSDVTVESVHRITTFNVRVSITNSSQSTVFIPISGEIDGEYFASVLTVNLEVPSKRGWIPPKTNPNSSVLGGIPPTKSVRVLPGESASFLYKLNPAFYSFKAKQRLRLSFLAWSDPSQIYKEPPTTKFCSPEIRLP